MSTVIYKYNMCINQSHYFDHSPICPESDGVSKETICSQENFTSRYQTHVTD